ncbi:MAG: hypothetical protein SVP52_05380 [Chloroflexota bacterium]|nr:hypothetical protein [Chloroflexota bacterium]
MFMFAATFIKIRKSIKKSHLTISLLISLWMVLTGCLFLSTDQNSQELQEYPSVLTDEEALPTSAHLQTHDPLPSSGGPFLLIQSNLADYDIFDLSTGVSTPFTPPTPNRQFKLKAILSPSGQKIFFTDDQENIILTDLVSGQILETLSFTHDEPIFQLNLTLEEVQSSFDETNFPDTSLLAFIESSYRQSISEIRWYQSDQYWLTARDATTTSTTLTLYDIESKTWVTLENQPGLVLDYQIAPGGNHILLKKGYINEPGYWSHHRYYLVDVAAQEAQPIPLPALVDNPRFTWLNQDTIGITHKTKTLGGVDFSVFDLKKRGLRQVIKGSFTHVSGYDQNLISIKNNHETGITTIALITYDGETLFQQDLNDPCIYKGRVNKFILVNCETNSLLLDEHLKITTLGKPISLMSSAPGGDRGILVNRDEETFLFDQNTLESHPIILEGSPLEIRWLPDGSSFLYRLSGELYLHDLAHQESTLVLTSAHLSDYTNINAVWINID